MKSLSERIEWYRSVESRRWKRIYHCVELAIISVTVLMLIGVVYFYGNGTKLQSLLVLFLSIFSFSSFLLIPGLYVPFFKRWQIFVLILGLGCGVGLSALACLFMLELQIENV